ncbi:MAG: mechanosensitive ion channel family protein [Sphingomonadales bacterium]
MDRVNDFWALTVDVWNHGLLGTRVGDILIAIGIVVLAVLVRRVFSSVVVASLKRTTARTKTDLDDVVVEAIAPPLRLVPVILGLYLAFRFLDPAPEYWVTLELIIRSLVAFAIFWAIYRAVAPMSRAARPLQTVLGGDTIEWVVKAVRLVVAFIGIAIVLEMWGIKVGPLLAGLGLFGVAVALGAQDLFKNLIAGMAILTEKRFAKGEFVSVDGVEGTVEHIGFRSTFLRRIDKAPVYLPNTRLADGAVANLSRFTQRRIDWVVGLEYRTTAAQLRAIRQRIEDYIMADDVFLKPPEGVVVVRVDALNASSIDIVVQCFTTSPDINVWRLAKENLAMRIKDIVEEEGAGFAFPSQSLYVEKGAANFADDEKPGNDNHADEEKPAPRPD